MLILRSSQASPFGRKVKIAATVLEVSQRIEIVVADTNDPSDPLRKQNPLGKIPALILESGETLYDSAVIVEYLESSAELINLYLDRCRAFGWDKVLKLFENSGPGYRFPRPSRVQASCQNGGLSPAVRR